MTTPVLFIHGAGNGSHVADGSLAESLQHGLGQNYKVVFPKMPNEANPDIDRWLLSISSQLSRITGSVILVGHSAGGAALLKFLGASKPDNRIAGLYLLAAPSWDEGNWNYDELKLPRDIAATLAPIPRIALYHCRDDDVVPFAHLALHSARIPQALTRALNTGGHQFNNDLSRVAVDILTVGEA